MTDPKNVPLDKARPGDMVFPKPLTIMRAGADYVSVTFSDDTHVDLSPEDIDHIERPARVLKVGDRVTDGASIREGEIVFMEGDEAVIRTSDSGIWVYALTDLEPVE